jgi:plastocyanin
MVLIAPIVGAVVVLSASLTSALPTRRSDSYNSNSCEGSGCEENKYEQPKCEGSGCDENKYTPPYEDNNKYTTTPYEENKYTTPYEENKYTTEENKYTTTTPYEENKYTTTSTSEKYETTTYGSGKPYWGGSEYQDCVNKCIADFPSDSSDSSSNDGGSGSNEKQGTYQANETKGTGGSKGTGATHTVVVAPSKGVFRMMPFHTTAAVGDTIEFHWGADAHTVTQSSALTPCNKSAGETVFASGTQNKDFVFTQAVNNTDPLYYFCGTPTHCDKGMFGIINGETAEAGSPDSFSGAWPDMAANSSDLAAFAAYSSSLTANNTAASTWGSTISMKNVPEELKPLYAANILFTRAALGANPELLSADSSVDLSSVKNVPMMVPEDLTDALNNAGSSPAPTTNGAPGADNAQAAAANPSAPATTGGASSLASSRVLVGAVVVLATFFAL